MKATDEYPKSMTHKPIHILWQTWDWTGIEQRLSQFVSSD